MPRAVILDAAAPSARVATPRAATLGPRAVISTGSGFELVASALMLADREGRHRFSELALWRRRARAMDAADVRTFEALGPHVVMNLVGLAAESPGDRAASDLLAHMASLPPAELILNAAGRYRRTILRGVPGDVIEDAVAGDPAARNRFLAESWLEVADWQRSLRFLLGGPPAEVAPRIVGAFQRWHDRVFVHEAPRLAAAQELEAATLRAESPAWRYDALLRRVAPTVEYVPPAGVELIEFVPVTSVKPIVVFLDHRMESILLVTSPDLPEDSEPPERLVLLGKALGDELRLRTLRALAGGPRTLGDLAAELGVPRTSLGHHIAILRAAGLVSHTIEDGRWGRLALRRDAIADVAPLFRDFVGHAPEGARRRP